MSEPLLVSKPLCKCGHPVRTHDHTGCRRGCGCRTTQEGTR